MTSSSYRDYVGKVAGFFTLVSGGIGLIAATYHFVVRIGERRKPPLA
jgi:hypothetical protein